MSRKLTGNSECISSDRNRNSNNKDFNTNSYQSREGKSSGVRSFNNMRFEIRHFQLVIQKQSKCDGQKLSISGLYHLNSRK